MIGAKLGVVRKVDPGPQPRAGRVVGHIDAEFVPVVGRGGSRVRRHRDVHEARQIRRNLDPNGEKPVGIRIEHHPRIEDGRGGSHVAEKAGRAIQVLLIQQPAGQFVVNRNVRIHHRNDLIRPGGGNRIRRNESGETRPGKLIEHGNWPDQSGGRKRRIRTIAHYITESTAHSSHILRGRRAAVGFRVEVRFTGHD